MALVALVISTELEVETLTFVTERRLINNKNTPHNFELATPWRIWMEMAYAN
jgi:hypothetical protein